MRTELLAVALLMSMSACDPSGPIQGVRGPCASATGTLLGCDTHPIDSPEDACWRLVECGVIPLGDPENNVLDWSRCITHIERLPDARYDFALTCIETSTCDDLKVEGSPVDPRNHPTALPLCLEHGDQSG